MRTEEPGSAEEAADLMRSAAADGALVRFKGGGTKFDWGNPVGEPDVLLSTKGLNRIVEHNAADLTAVLEAGVALAEAQDAFAEADQMLALDPPGQSATIGGILATGDSGPLRHRYGGPRDQLLGMTVALSDGTVARSGGKVIKNVAGYDLAKLFTGSFGTLGLITRVAVRLHPLPRKRMSAIGYGEDPDQFQAAAITLAQSPLELESLDLYWPEWGGRLVARCAGAAPEPRVEEAVRLMAKAGLRADDETDDKSAFDRSGDASRTNEATVVRVSALPSELARIIRVVMRLQGSLVARAGLGICWVWIPPMSPDRVVAAIEDLRFSVSPFPCVVLDAPTEVRKKVDVWGIPEGPELELMRRLKSGFDPAGVCNPGLFAGGI